MARIVVYRSPITDVKACSACERQTNHCSLLKKLITCALYEVIHTITPAFNNPAVYIY